MAVETQFNQQFLQELFTNHELLVRETARPGPSGLVRKVGIVGGGTAGWMTALALQAQLPWLEITVIESSTIPIIGVGEASVPSLVSFIHHYLKLDVFEFTRAVSPTWKQGIRFEWGLPGSYVFQAPFDWDVNGIGMLGSMGETGDVNSFTVQAMLMAKDVTPILRDKGQLRTFLPAFSFAYHLDNAKLVRFLTDTAIARGVKHLDRKITDAEVVQGADGEPSIERLVGENGEALVFDLYVDCSGFRSLLLEQKLGEKFESYASSLFTDSALAFNAPNKRDPKPYTTARTMDHGWAWTIPMIDDDHHGYVFSSSHCSQDQAHDEAKKIWPEMSDARLVKFRSGRHERLWVGNTIAIGNAYAFVEPLESTGLLMITRAITSLVRSFPITDDHAVQKRFVNATVGRDWDRLRFFLAVHYKFNKRSESKFWSEVRERVDVSGVAEALEIFRTMGPLSLLPRAVRASLVESAGVFFYGLPAFDNILLGQKVPHPKLEREPPSAWRDRRALAAQFVQRAISQKEALKALEERPKWLSELIHHPQSWVMRAVPYL